MPNAVSTKFGVLLRLDPCMPSALACWPNANPGWAPSLPIQVEQQIENTVHLRVTAKFDAVLLNDSIPIRFDSLAIEQGGK